MTLLVRACAGAVLHGVAGQTGQGGASFSHDLSLEVFAIVPGSAL